MRASRSIGGFIKIEIQRNPPAVGWQDVTMEILNHGIAGRNITSRNAANTANTAVWNGAPGDNGAAPVATCPLEPMPNSILRLQRVRDVPQAAGFNLCGLNGANMSQDTHDYWPLALYDTREGQFRDGLRGVNPNTPYTIRLGGIMNYLELDIANLSRWLQGLGAYAGGSGTSAKNENGFVIYFSDRRNNRNPATNRETGEYGMEDVINTPNMQVPSGQLEAGEDVNGDGQLQNYGGAAQAVHVPLCTVGCLLTANPFAAGSGHMTVIPNAARYESGSQARGAGQPQHAVPPRAQARQRRPGQHRSARPDDRFRKPGLCAGELQRHVGERQRGQ